MFKISDFSKLSQVSMRTLRYYDEIGLLKPVRVDDASGYRYYSVDQLPLLNRILALKDLGFELAQIVQLLDEHVPSEQLRGMLRLKQIELQQRVQSEQERLARVEARLKQIEVDTTSSVQEVALKKVRPMIVASSRKVVANSKLKQQFAHETLQFLKENGVVQMDHLFFIDPDEGYRDSELGMVEVAVPVQSSSVGNIVERSGGRTTIRQLPGVNTMATLLYQGSPYTLMEAYQALGMWIQANDYSITGPCRQVSLQQTDDLEHCVTELQFPVEKLENASTKHAFSTPGKRSPANV